MTQDDLRACADQCVVWGLEQLEPTIAHLSPEKQAIERELYVKTMAEAVAEVSRLLTACDGHGPLVGAHIKAVLAERLR